MPINNIKNILLLLILVHLGINLRCAYIIYQLTSTGAIAMFPFLFWVFGSLSLYIAAIRLLFKRKSNGKLFAIAGSLFFVCIPPFWPYPPVYIFMVVLGAVLGGTGWWVNKK